jgi:hypothetical protein
VRPDVIKTSAILLMVAALVAAPSVAAVSPDGMRITGRAGDERTASVAVVPDGTTALVVWMWYAGTDAGWEVYGRLVDADGPVAPVLRISGSAAQPAPGFQGTPRVAADPSGAGYLVVWGDARDAARGFDVWGRRIGSDGSRLGGEFRISGPAATGDDRNPAVAAHPGGGYLVVWSDGRDPVQADIRAQAVAADGERIGPNRRVSGPAAVGDDERPAVIAHPDTGAYLVVWSDGRDAARGTDVFGQVLSAASERIGPNRRISGPRAATDAGDPGVAARAGAGFLVVWSDGRNAATGDQRDLYGQRLSALGERTGPDLRIAGGPAEQYHGETAPAVGGWRVVWEEVVGTSPSVIHGGVLNDGAAVPSGGVVVPSTGSQRGPAIAPSPLAAGALVVWSDAVSGAGLDVWGAVLGSG